MQAHEAQLVADAAVGEWLRVIQAQAGHPEISRFLAECWQAVMRAAFAADATKGCNGRIAMPVRRICSTASVPARVPTSVSLMLQIPALIKRLNAGLDLANIAPEIRKPYLDVRFDLQTALRQRPAEGERNHGACVTSQYKRTRAMPRCRQANPGAGRQTGAFTSARRPRQAGAAPYRGKEGDWLAFRLPDHEAHCGSICWQGALRYRCVVQ